jgi:hypothetical protein
MREILEEQPQIVFHEQSTVEKEARAFWIVIAIITAVPMGFIVYFLLQ